MELGRLEMKTSISIEHKKKAVHETVWNLLLYFESSRAGMKMERISVHPSNGRVQILNGIFCI